MSVTSRRQFLALVFLLMCITKVILIKMTWAAKMRTKQTEIKRSQCWQRKNDERKKARKVFSLERKCNGNANNYISVKQI